jgi:hypothetical protein
VVLAAAQRAPGAMPSGRCGAAASPWTPPNAHPIHLAIDWTIDRAQHLSVVSLVVGRRAVPIYGRASAAAVRKGRLKRYEHAVIRRAMPGVLRKVSVWRVRVTADHSVADGALFTLWTTLGVAFVIRMKHRTKICVGGSVAKAQHAAFFRPYPPSRRGAPTLLCADPAATVSDDESPAGCAGDIGPLILGGESSLVQAEQTCCVIGSRFSHP